MVPGQARLPGILQRSKLVQQQREVLTRRIHPVSQPNLLSEEPGCLVPVLGCQLSVYQAVVLPEGSLHQQGPCPSICSHVSEALRASAQHIALTGYSGLLLPHAAPCNRGYHCDASVVLCFSIAL